MQPISKQPVSQDQIEAYKAYFKRINIAQYGAGVLMDALNQGSGASSDPLLDGANKDSAVQSMFPEKPATLNINTDAVYKKMWKDLEALIKEYEVKNPDIKGQYIVAVNADTQDGQPAVKIAQKDDVMSLLGDADRKSIEGTIDQHPVQVFKSANVDVNTLQEASIPGLQAEITAFLDKNKGVFQFLASQQAATDQAAQASMQ